MRSPCSWLEKGVPRQHVEQDGSAFLIPVLSIMIGTYLRKRRVHDSYLSST